MTANPLQAIASSLKQCVFTPKTISRILCFSARESIMLPPHPTIEECCFELIPINLANLHTGGQHVTRWKDNQ